MPYISDTLQDTEKDEEEKKKNGDLAETGDISVATAPTDMGSEAAPVTQGSTTGTLDTGMKGTAAQKYVEANQNVDLAGRITKKLSEREKELERLSGEETQSLQSKTGFGLDQGNLKQLGGGEIARIQKVKESLPGLYQKSAQDLQSYMNSPEYQDYLIAKRGEFNTYDVEKLPQLQQDVSAFQTKAGLGTNEAGRFQLLREVFSRPDREYTSGQQSLDQLLLQSKTKERQILEDYAKVAGVGAKQQLTDLEKLQQLAKAKTQEEIGLTQKSLTSGAEQTFGGIEQNALTKLREYNTNKNRVSDLYSKLMTGTGISQDDQNFLRQNTSGDVANRMLGIAKNLSYQTPFGEGVRDRFSATNWQGHKPDEAESYTYNYGQLTPQDIIKALNTANIDESYAGKSRFATAEDVAKQQALESLYQGELGTNLANVNNRLLSNQIGTEGVNVGGIEKVIQERKDMTEKTRDEEAQEAATAANLWYYNTWGQSHGYGHQPGDRDATATAYKYLKPGNEWEKLSDNELREVIASDSETNRLFGEDPAIGYLQREYMNQYGDMLRYGENPMESMQEYVSRGMAGVGGENRLSNMFADKVIEERNKKKAETVGREGGYFNQLRQFFGLS